MNLLSKEVSKYLIYSGQSNCSSSSAPEGFVRAVVIAGMLENRFDKVEGDV
jgi:hypothetical protein